VQDTTLFGIALSVAGVGLIILFLALLSLEHASFSLAEIPHLSDGSKARVSGTITHVAHRGNVTVLTISHPSSIDAVIFTPVNATPGSCVMVSGTKSTYEGNPQLITKKIITC